MEITCPFCAESRTRRFSPIGPSYHRCKTCGSILQRPLPDQAILDSYYESYLDIKEEMNPGYLDPSSWENHRRERDKTLAELGFPRKRIASLSSRSAKNVELGCANGLFLRYLVEAGSSNTTGIDVSATLLSRIALPGLRLIQGGLEDIEEGGADNLFLFNVAEHVRDIEGLFAQASRVCAPGALAVVEVPLGGFLARLHGKTWRFLMKDEHLNIPSVRGLSLLSARHGFAIRGSTRFGSGFTTGSIPMPLKRLFDWLAKKTRTGERGAFLLERL